MPVDMLIAHVLIDCLYCRRTKTPDGLKITNTVHPIMTGKQFLTDNSVDGKHEETNATD